MFRIFRSILASIANLTNEPPKTPYRRDAYFQSDVDYNLHRWFGASESNAPTRIFSSSAGRSSTKTYPLPETPASLNVRERRWTR
jgi:hypothetical protein